MASSDLRVGATYRTMVEATVTTAAEVIVVGGGTAGVVAAIAAARQGADTLLVERRGFLGGMMTAGNAGLTDYIVFDRNLDEHRKIVGELATEPAAVHVVGGIPMEITRRLITEGHALGTSGQPGAYVFTDQQEFKRLLLTMMEEAGVRLLLHSLFVDVVMDGDAVAGVVVENKSGRQVLLGKVVIDASGDGDVAAKAGAPYVIGVGPDDLGAKAGVPLGSMGGMGAMFRVGNVDLERFFQFLFANPQYFQMQRLAQMSLGEAYDAFKKGDMVCIVAANIGYSVQIYNTPLPGVLILCCPSFVGSGLSVGDLTQGELVVMKETWARFDAMKARLPGFEAMTLLNAPEIQVRETRHIQGEYVLNIEDIHLTRHFDDAIGRGSHVIDTSPVPESLKNFVLPPRWQFSIPYRCLVPKGVSNLLLAGRCISATHEASGCTRPTVQCMITGEAAGVAAAICAAEGIAPRAVDIVRLRRTLADQGVIL